MVERTSSLARPFSCGQRCCQNKEDRQLPPKPPVFFPPPPPKPPGPATFSNVLCPLFGRYRRRDGDRHFDFGALAAARNGRLEGAARVVLAIGQAKYFGLAAEVEVSHLRIADRPAAAALGQRLNGFALGDWNDQLFGGRNIGLPFTCEEAANRRVSGNCKARFVGRSFDVGHALARTVRFHARCGGATREAKAMDLADDGIARDASEPSGDLTGAQPFRPELL